MKLRTRTYILGSTLSVLSIFGALLFIFPSQNASAAIGDVCHPPLSSEMIEACTDGYNNGVGDGSVCSQYDGDQALVDICEDGFDQYVTDLNRCTGTRSVYTPVRQRATFASHSSSYTRDAKLAVPFNGDPGIYTNPNNGQPKSEEECKQELRGGQNNPSNPNNTTSQPQSPPPEKDVGQIPDDGSIVPMAHKQENGQPVESNAQKCGIDGFFGTTVCGLTLMTAKVTDGAFYVLKVFLETEPVFQTGRGGGDSTIYLAWSILRGFANVFMVIAFLVIIYSYITNAGIDNYGLKRMIPRLIAGAILINLSFWICAIFVDISNILGKVLIDVIPNVINLNDANNNPPEYSGWADAVGSVLFVGSAAIAGGAAVMYGSFSALAPILASAVIAIVTTFVLLMIRQVLIILFIVVSPLAFAAILLPNTHSWFEKWRKAFVPILMLYPVVSFIFGMSQLAAIMIRNVGIAQSTDPDMNTVIGVLLIIFSLGIQIAPLLLIPRVMKLGGNLMNKWVGSGEGKLAKGLKGKAQDYADRKQKERDIGALWHGAQGTKSQNPLKQVRNRAIQRRYSRQAKSQQISNQLATAQLSSFANQLQNSPRMQKQLSQSSNAGLMKSALNHVLHARVKAKADAVKVQQEANVAKGQTREQRIEEAINSAGHVSEIAQEAAILSVAQSGDIGALLNVMKNSTNMTVKQRRKLIETAAQSGAVNGMPMLADSDVRESFAQDGYSNFIGQSIAEGDHSPENVAALDQDVAKEIADYIDQAAQNGTDIPPEKIKEITKAAAAATDATNNPETAAKVAKNRDQLIRIASYDTHNWGES